MNFLLLLMVFEKIELVLPAKTYAAPCSSITREKSGTLSYTWIEMNKGQYADIE